MRHNNNERGIAMITTLLVLMLISALLVGFTTVVMSDQRYRFIDRDRAQAFYAASAGVEKLTADLGNLFLSFVAPTTAQVTNLTLTPPSISGITFTSPTTAAGLPASQLTTYHCFAAGTKTLPLVGTNGYTIRYCANAGGNPTISDDPLIIGGTGAYAGMTALQTPYQIDVTAKTATGGEVHLVRTIQSVAIPVFQFGVFSDSDLSFSAAANFSFGGRIHTNGNLFLAEGNGSTLTSTGKITAVGDVVRQFLSNGTTIGAMGMTGTVSLATSGLAPAGNRNLVATEGSVVGMPGTAAYANWQTLSLGATPLNYNGFIKTTATGAKRLTLPLTATGIGGTNADLVRRPPVGEDPNSVLYNERLFSKASLRIMLSDTAADITNMPGVTATAPVSLEGINWNTTPPNNGTAYGGVNAANGRPPIAISTGVQTMNTTAATAAAATTISVNNPIAYFQPALGISVGVGGPFSQVGITCLGRTTTTFTLCTPATNVSIAAGQPVQVAINGQTVSTTLTANFLFNSPTMTVASTAGFAPGVFWLKPTVGQPMLVSCTGLSTPVAAAQLTGCAGVTAAASNGAAITTSALSANTVGLIGGVIKIERASAVIPPVWTDVTMEVLNYGIGGLNLEGQLCNGGVELSPNAVIRLQRLKDNAGGTPITNGGGCNYAGDTTGYRDPTNWWPNVLFDTREAVQRDADPGTSATGLPLVGLMYYVTVDAKNLAKWFRASGAPFNAGTGAQARTDNGGYTLYFSDRRNNRNAASQETAEFGWEDFVNPGVATGAPNGVCDLPGEDVNSNLACETYGGTANFQGAFNTAPTGAAAPLTTAATPITLVTQGQAETNRPIFFRRALKLVNGATLGSDAVVANRITGLTVVSENPVYIQGDWNAAATFLVNDLHAATAVIADAVTILSNNWVDTNSLEAPYSCGAKCRLRTPNSYYRVAILGGKPPTFLKPGDVPAASSFGQDGGAHNFIRMIEQSGGAANTLNYRGSMATLFYGRQATGTFKGQGMVYSIPVRNFIFDTDFLTPALLPPNTPMFRDMNVVGFSQELRPGK